MPCVWTTARPLIREYVGNTLQLDSLSDLQPSELNELYGMLPWEPPAESTEDEVRDKKSLIAWIARNMPQLKGDRRLETAALVKQSMQLRGVDIATPATSRASSIAPASRASSVAPTSKRQPSSSTSSTRMPSLSTAPGIEQSGPTALHLHAAAQRALSSIPGLATFDRQLPPFQQQLRAGLSAPKTSIGGSPAPKTPAVVSPSPRLNPGRKAKPCVPFLEDDESDCSSAGQGEAEAEEEEEEEVAHFSDAETGNRVTRAAEWRHAPTPSRAIKQEPIDHSDNIPALIESHHPDAAAANTIVSPRVSTSASLLDLMDFEDFRSTPSPEAQPTTSLRELTIADLILPHAAPASLPVEHRHPARPTEQFHAHNSMSGASPNITTSSSRDPQGSPPPPTMPRSFASQLHPAFQNAERAASQGEFDAALAALGDITGYVWYLKQVQMADQMAAV